LKLGENSKTYYLWHILCRILKDRFVPKRLTFGAVFTNEKLVPKRVEFLNILHNVQVVELSHIRVIIYLKFKRQ